MSGGERFSVVVPAYQRATTIETTLASVRRAADERDRLGRGPTEIVVVDDGSTDGTGDIARAIATTDDRVRLLRQPNAGVSAARNLGARHASGRWLAFLDCDDTVDPTWLVQFDRALTSGARLVFAPAHAIEPDGRDRPWRVRPLGPAFADVAGLFNPGMFAVAKADFDAVGGYAPALRYSENTDLGIRLTEHLEREGPIPTVTLTDLLVTVAIPERHGSNANSPENRLHSALYLLDVHAERLDRDPRLHGDYWAIAGVAAIRLGRARLARDCFLRAARTDPSRPKHAARALAASCAPLRRQVWRQPR